MKEIGEKLKATREEIGISKEEVCEDLKLDMKQLDQLEEGDMQAFPDILSLKYLIRDYAKYLGLDKDDLVDEFNEFLFDYTSKISLDDIKKAKKKAERNQAKKDKRIASPYTIERRKKINLKIVLLVFLSILAMLMLVFIVKQVVNNTESNQPIDNVIR